MPTSNIECSNGQNFIPMSHHDSSNSLQRYISAQYGRIENSDVLITVIRENSNSTTFPLHKLVLRQCEYFEGMFVGNRFEEACRRVINIEIPYQDYDDTCVEIFFRMLYTFDLQCIPGITERVVQLHGLCSMFLFTRGSKYCLDLMKTLMDVNCDSLLCYGRQNNYSDVTSSCERWIGVMCGIHERAAIVLPTLDTETAFNILNGDHIFATPSEISHLKWAITGNPSQSCGEELDSNTDSIDFKFVAGVLNRTAGACETVTWRELEWGIFSLMDRKTKTWKIGLSNRRTWAQAPRSSMPLKVRLNARIIGKTRTFIMSELVLIAIDGMRKDTSQNIPWEFSEDAFVADSDFDADELHQPYQDAVGCDGPGVLFFVVNLSIEA